MCYLLKIHFNVSHENCVDQFLCSVSHKGWNEHYTHNSVYEIQATMVEVMAYLLWLYFHKNVFDYCTITLP